VRRVPLVVVAVLVAMVLTSVVLRWRAPRSPATRVRPTVATMQPDASARSGEHGMGAGAPPAVEAPPGARMLHGDARHTDRAAGHAPLAAPEVQWTVDVGGPVEAQVTTSPDGQTLYVASLEGSLTAIARDTGTVRWTLPLHERAYATPAVADDGTIFAGSDAKKFVAVTPEGRVRWSLDTDGEADTGATIAPDSTVVFAAGRMVYGVTPLAWVKWRFAAKRKVFAAPVVAPTSGRVYFGSQDHHAYGLTPQGGPLWSTDLGADVDGAPAIGDDGAVFFGTDGGDVARLDPDDGHVVWHTQVGGFVRGTLSVARNGDVLAGVYGPTPRAVRLRGADGTVVGDFAVQGTGAREFGVHGGALEDEAGTLLFGAQDDAVTAIDAEGNVLWRWTAGADVDAPVTLLPDGSLVVASDDGKVVLLRSRSG
jgi:outer membrane protein assembly factor BamB